MNKTEILNIVNEPSKHIQIVKVDGKDSIVYSSKLVELLELIPTMLTKADMVAILDKIRDEIERKAHSGQWSDATMYGMLKAVAIIDKYKAESEIHCNCTDAEIAKSFIEDVEAVKDLLPQESEE